MMPWIYMLAAAAQPTDNRPPIIPDAGGAGTNNLLSSQMRDVMIIGGAALAMALVLFLWAYLTRKNRQLQSATVRGSRILVRPERKDPSEGDGRRRRKRKRRPEHPDNLGRNPTLAEAGGLPPLRPDEPEPPAEQASSPEGPSPSPLLPPGPMR